jgi:hypothetical protein
MGETYWVSLLGLSLCPSLGLSPGPSLGLCHGHGPGPDSQVLNLSLCPFLDRD